MSEKKIIFSGAQPSGKMTLGNYLGAIQNWTKLQDEYDCFYSVVDLHAITVPQEAKNLRANTMQLLAQLIQQDEILVPKSKMVSLLFHFRKQIPYQMGKGI